MQRPDALLAQFAARARSKLRSPADVLALADGAAGKLASGGAMAGQMANLREDVRTLLALTRSWARGEYRAVSASALVTVLGALLYFVMPTDAVPDFLLGIGFVDDAAVVAYALRAVKGELDAYRHWCAQRVCSPPAQSIGDHDE